MCLIKKGYFDRTQQTISQVAGIYAQPPRGPTILSLPLTLITINVNLSIFYSYGALFLSILVGISRTSVLNIWLIIEVNAIVFLLTLLVTRESLSSQALVKYFLVQALSSMIIVLGTSSSISSIGGVIIAQVALLVKLGAVPGHSWYLSVVQDLRWLNIFIMSTFQKLLPLFLLTSLCTTGEVLFLSSLSLTSGFIAIGSSTLKRLVGFSRILNLG